MKKREGRQSGTADCCAESRAEKCTDDENDDAARAARQNSPQNADQRQRQKHICPRLCFDFIDDFADQLAGEISDHRRNQVDDGDYADNPKIFNPKDSFFRKKFDKHCQRRKRAEQQTEIGKSLFDRQRIFHHCGCRSFLFRSEQRFFTRGFGVGGEQHV